MRKYLLLVFFFATSLLAVAQTYANIDDSLTDWNKGCGSAIAGGTGTPTAGPTQTIDNTSFSLDGDSMEVTFTGQVLSGGNTTNCLWYFKPGGNDAINTFVGTYHVYIPSLSNVQALEYDQFHFVNPGPPDVRYMMGSQCVIGGNWQIWNSCGGSWHDAVPTVSCSLSAAAWHSIVWSTSHDPITSTACSSEPCMYYRQLTIDGTSYGPFQSYPACSSSDADNLGIQFQIDVTQAGGATSEFLDEMSLTVSTNGFGATTWAIAP